MTLDTCGCHGLQASQALRCTGRGPGRAHGMRTSGDETAAASLQRLARFDEGALLLI